MVILEIIFTVENVLFYFISVWRNVDELKTWSSSKRRRYNRPHILYISVIQRWNIERSLPLPFVNDLKHLGNVLQSDNSMTIDCNEKRAIFISKIYSLNQEFYFNSPRPELKTLEWWISRLILKLLVLLNPRLC